MEPKHTAGPWLEDDGIIYSEAVKHEEAWIADLRGAMNPRENARLIVAAPALLAALREAMDDTPGWYDSARAAIVLAEGRAS